MVKASISELARRATRCVARMESHTARAYYMHEIECVERLAVDSLIRLMRELLSS